MQTEGGTGCSTEHLETDKTRFLSQRFVKGERKINVVVILIFIQYRHICVGATGHSYSASIIFPNLIYKNRYVFVIYVSRDIW